MSQAETPAKKTRRGTFIPIPIPFFNKTIEKAPSSPSLPNVTSTPLPSRPVSAPSGEGRSSMRKSLSLPGPPPLSPKKEKEKDKGKGREQYTQIHEQSKALFARKLEALQARSANDVLVV